MKKLFLMLAALLAWAGPAAAKPVWSWVSANEYYMILPVSQDLNLSAGGSEKVKPWGFGLRAVGSETVSKTGALQLQSLKADGERVYLLELLLGLEYLTPKTAGRPLRFKAAAFGDLGLSDNSMFIAPVVSAGLLYTTDEAAATPKGLTFDIFYRLSDIDLDNVGNGRTATLEPSLGFKVGYIFEGFWTVKDKE